ncbi:hypothetical protein GGU10DRAFT_123871 [Lentinula aff. detonsa]|uniref:Thioesterase domain-containing protein n=1 Tax=Lentinula aff. detonsa TaxID=2804958 RepID=A0AA38NDW3_9AGAR|nr:hypothetical protein GGU10DRAFT_123871 [Lentinula aff. detonsa]
MPPSSSSSSSPSQASHQHNLRLIDGISGNCSPTIKQAFLNPGMIFPTLDRDGKYRVLGFAMETIFQRAVVTHISSSNTREGRSSKFQSDKLGQVENSADSFEKPIETGQSITLICEIDVLPDMANNHHILHGGCTAFLIDMCSSLSVVALTLIMKAKSTGLTDVDNFPPKLDLLSQSLNVVYHSPSQVGDKLRIVCTTMPMRELTSNVCVQTEIWSIVRHRLVASGVQNMMKMSPNARL